MFLPKSHKKLTLHPKYTPMQTFLSPANKYNQRSFSTSALTQNQRSPIVGSLRDQIRLQTFKRNILAQSTSKLNKTSLHRTNAKQYWRGEDSRSQLRDTQRQMQCMKQQNYQLRQQRKQDLFLISHQNQIIIRLEQQLNECLKKDKKVNPCECYQIQEYMNTIRTMQTKIRHLQQQKKQYKQEIRNLIVKQEGLKKQLNSSEQYFRQQRIHNSKLQQLVYAEDRHPNKKQNYYQFKKQTEHFKRQPIYKIQSKSPKGQPRQLKIQTNKQQSGVHRYMEYLKNVRNRQIDQIENILKSE